MQLYSRGTQVPDERPIFDFAGFYRALDATRQSRGLNWKNVADEAAVSASTLARMPQNRRPDADGLAALAAWSGLNPGDYVLYAGRARAPEPLAQIATALRNDPQLEPTDAEALEDIVRAAYASMRRKRPSPAKA
jgi:transcriptional regulator with XRE-family HTH domain